MMEQVRIFDTSLRDGEQAPGFSMSEDAKLRVARALAALKVDVIEAGFAAASPGDARSIVRIAEEVEGPVICSLARATDGDIPAAGAALANARRHGLHVFLRPSPIQPAATLDHQQAQGRDEVPH